MNCTFTSRSAGLIACTRCGREVPTSQPPDKVRARCRSGAKQEPRKPCIHLGPQTRLQKCRTCSGNVQLKIFSCRQLGGECTVGKPVDAVPHCCATCPSHQAEDSGSKIEDSKTPSARPTHAGYPLSSRPLRVGLLTPTFCTGGVERWWLSLCRHWAPSADIVIAGIALTDGAETDQGPIDEALCYGPVHGSCQLDAGGRNANGLNRHLSGAAAAAALCASCDVIITWGHADAARFLKDFRGQIVLVSHGAAEWTRTIISRASWDLSGLKTKLALAAVSQAARDTFPVSVRERVTVIPNGIDFDRITPSRPRLETRIALGLKAGWRAIGFVGRFSAEKNPLAAARAAAELQSSIAVYAGAHFNRPEPQTQVRAVTERCRFFVPGPFLGDVYAALDCLVACAPAEGGPLVVLEAWAAGLPVVATAVGVIPEIERDFECSLVERVALDATAADLAAAVLRAIDDTDRTNYARLIAWQHFSAARMAADWRRFLLNAANS